MGTIDEERRTRGEAAGTTTEIVATGFGDPGVLAVVQGARRAPAPNEVTVADRAVGVNPRDYKSYADRAYATARGRMPVFPMQLGVEASGVIVAAGAEAVGPAGPIVSRRSPGRRAAWRPSWRHAR